MKKFISAFMCVCLIAVSVFAFSGCTKLENLSCDVLLITDGGTIKDGSYNESAWNGVEEYCKEANLSCRYYQPTVDDNGAFTDDTIASYVDIGVKNGAKYIVLPGDSFETVAYTLGKEYPDVNFILLDGTPHSAKDNIEAILSNVMCVSFDVLQSGFLAGYNAVISGNTKLGYFGSISSEQSSNYGAGYVQGAAYAADQLGTPVTMQYADYDSPLLNYNYSFTVTANYEKIEDTNEDCFVVKVENGTGSGTYTNGANVKIKANPAESGKVFDHWEYKSDTEGVKDKKVNLSTTKKDETNLLVEKCNCTITAVYKDAESDTIPVIVTTPAGDVQYNTQYITNGSSCEVKAPTAEYGTVFDHWEVSVGSETLDSTAENDKKVIDDFNSADTWVHMGAEPIKLVPVFVSSDTPTFNITVETGEGGNGESTGSGSYVTDDTVNLVAAVPKEGYIFKNWTTTDENGYNCGCVMENEYFPTTSFPMVNRFQGLVENMLDDGVTMMYAGGNKEDGAVAEAVKSYSFKLQAIGAENYQKGWENYYSITIKDFGSAVKACLANYKGGSSYVADCSNDGIWMTFVDDENKESYDDVYSKLAKGDIKLTAVAPGADVRLCYKSKCLSLNYWITE